MFPDRATRCVTKLIRGRTDSICAADPYKLAAMRNTNRLVSHLSHSCPDAHGRLAVALTVAGLLMAGCGSTAEQLADAAQSRPTPTIEIVMNLNTPSALPEAAVTPSPISVPTPAPAPTQPPAARVDVRVVAQGFGQDGRQVGYAFLVENPNAGLAVENTQYQLAAYDDAGAVVETDSGYIQFLLPGQQIGVADTMYLDEGVALSRIEVQLSQGKATAFEPTAWIEVERARYIEGRYSRYATAVLSNPFDRDITNLVVSAVAYDDAGQIIGGGFTYLNFLLAGGATGVRVSIEGLSQVARVEVYATLSGLSTLNTARAQPADAQAVTIIDAGFGQDGQSAGYGFLARNPNANYAVERSMYRLTAYAADGTVVSAEEGYIELLLPGQTLGVAGDLYLAENTAIERVEAQLYPGQYVKSEALPSFDAENVVYLAGDYASRVTGQILNPYAKDITQMRVSAIAYDAAGKIIGGGFTFLDFAPASGRAAVEVNVTTAGPPARVELHAAVSGLSDFK